MDVCRALCGLTVVITVLSKGCHSMLQECGLASNNAKIVGGQNVAPGSWPWQVILVEKVFGPFCGGSIISSEWVLTAAHCLSPGDKVTVRMGLHGLSGPNPNEVSRPVDKIICHPEYSRFTFNNDICLLKLSAPVNFTDYVFPVCLASENSTLHTGTSSWITGWGATGNGSFPNILQEVNVPVVGNNECNCSYGDITENMICAGLTDGGKDSCQGDSGGPMVTKEGNTWVQIGVVSWGEGCALPYFPGVYARVSQYQEWISNITGSMEPGFVSVISSGEDSDGNYTCLPRLTTTTTTRPTPSTPPIVTRDCESVFCGADSVIHFSYFTHFISLCVLLLSLYVLVGDA